MCRHTDTRLLAAMVPEAAVAGMPIPGKTESPHSKRPMFAYNTPHHITGRGGRASRITGLG